MSEARKIDTENIDNADDNEKVDQIIKSALADSNSTGPTDYSNIDPLTYREYTLNDEGNSRRFADEYEGQVICCVKGNDWYIWNGRFWEIDERDRIIGLASQSISDFGDYAAQQNSDRRTRFAVDSGNEPRIKRLLRLTKHKVAVVPDELDNDPYLLNCQNGVVDLRTGELLTHDPQNLMTKICAPDYDSSAKCPRFLQFLDEVFGEDDEMKSFLQKALGYSLTGDVSENVFFVLNGEGANGKTVLMNTFLNIVGGYGDQSPAELLIAKKHKHSTIVRDLKGLRFVSVSETNEGDGFDTALAKQLTGGDRIDANRMHQDHETFKSTAKIFLVTNHLPDLSEFGEAIQRRLVVIPFNRIIPREERDIRLTESLTGEAEGILAWMVQGYMELQENGLTIPDICKQASREYLQSRDQIGQFIEECCKNEGSVRATQIYQKYTSWCSSIGEEPMKQAKFGRELAARGYKKDRDAHGNFYLGISHS